ncbi:monoheme cytochrome C [uncultured Allomuricauda sp.]|uniref:monoheme cytochrome C n=1 Tax=Flagellimonas sp. W118 TaxID=3410791 RepID=UPI0026288A1B|nr:monoheme cytochrome C [uncultured Allomuricauda sp.]
MEDLNKFRKSADQILRLMYLVFFVFIIIAGFLVYLLVDPSFSAFKKNDSEENYISIQNQEVEDFDKIENGIHVRTGFVEGEGLQLVVNNCTSCHSAKLVTQNRMSKEQWSATIRWMQETQNLWDLGQNEEAILTYLATHYAPKKGGRRQNLSDIEWYDLEQ